MKKITMKKILLSAGIALLSGFASAQNGLENVIVETYYIANAADVAGSVGTLPIGSVTYRLFADMLPGYKFEALYGVSGHTLTVNSTTPFFNNEDRGATTPAFTKAQAAHNSIMLDSWFSAGGACSNAMGVPKSDDNGVANQVVVPAGMLVNTIGFPIALTTQDGFIAGTPQAVTFVGITNGVSTDDLSVLDGTSLVGNTFSTANGSVASLNGSVGPDTVTNKVLIGQFTTDGVFCFELNIQIGTPLGGVQNYVASNPVGSEIQANFLTYCNNTVNVPNVKMGSGTAVVVYPNPASNAITFVITSSSLKSNSYRIFDVVGNVIADKNIGAITGKYFEDVDVSNLSKGMYFIEFNLDGVKTVKKIIKE